jgi:hypothetical protein
MRTTRRFRDTTARWTVLALVVALVVVATPAGGRAQDAESGDGPWIISVGDSYISGEGGRWAGNTNEATWRNDALGPTAYYDNPDDTGELIPYCHRSKSAEVHIGGEVNSLNLACSGAETTTYWTGTLDDVFKPGIDFYDDGSGHKGQAQLLQEAAAGKDVQVVVLSIGGNDFDVSGAVETCAEDFAESIPDDDSYCNADQSVVDQFSPSAAQTVRDAIVAAIANIRTAMTNAGHPEGTYTLVVQDYPLPIPSGDSFRYPEAGYERIDTGGCGLWNSDADFIGQTIFAVVSDTVRAAVTQAGGDIVRLELGSMLDARQLCETGVGLLEEEGLGDWEAPGASDLTEWANPIFVDTVTSEHFQQESMHPNYWAQLALRNCLRQVWNDGSPVGGSCSHTTGLNAAGEPNVVLARSLDQGAPDPSGAGTGSPPSSPSPAAAVTALSDVTG